MQYAFFVIFAMLALPEDMPAGMPGIGTPTTLAAVCGGQVVPLTMTLGRLDDTWRRLSVDAASGEKTLGRAAAEGFGAHLPGVAFTQGKWLCIDGEDYLVAYGTRNPVLNQADLVAYMNGDKIYPPLTPETTLSLSLIKRRTIGVYHDIRSVNVPAEIAATVHPLTPAMLNRLSDSNLRRLGAALNRYCTKNQRYPDLPAATLKATLRPYLDGEDDIFQHPGTHQPYAFNPGLNAKRLDEFNNLGQVMLAFEAEPAADNTRGVVYADGHLARLPEEQWQRERLRGETPPLTAEELNAESLSRLRTLGKAVLRYARENNGQFPPLRDAETTKTILKLYLRDETLFLHPVQQQPYLFNPALSTRSERNLPNRADLVLAYDPSPAPNGSRAAVFADGHTEVVGKERWEQVGVK